MTFSKTVGLVGIGLVGTGIKEILERCMASGEGDLDTSAVIRELRRMQKPASP